jgi:putative DNA primase/helicase
VSGGGLAAIVRALGGDLYADGGRANVPGPGHSPADRSVSLMLSDGRVIAHSFAGDGWRAVLDHLFERGLVDLDGRLVDAGVASAAPGPSARERRAIAQGLWAEGRPITGTLSETHLRSRGVVSFSPALRHHPGVPAAVYAARGLLRPALLAAITAPAGEVTGVEVTYLAPNGVRARMSMARKTIGVRAPGSAVRLDPPAPRMLVGEGLATCLSAAARFGLPAWALLSTGNLRAWRPPPGVAFVVIAADRGRDGERSALVLAAALRARGVRGAIRWPPAPFGDWNEAWVAIQEGK